MTINELLNLLNNLNDQIVHWVRLHDIQTVTVNDLEFVFHQYHNQISAHKPATIPLNVTVEQNIYGNRIYVQVEYGQILIDQTFDINTILAAQAGTELSKKQTIESEHYPDICKNCGAPAYIGTFIGRVECSANCGVS